MELIGQMIAGKYRLDRLIGEGGFGVVYAGQHVAMSRSVALKVIFMSDSGGAGSPNAIARFSQEARLISQLRSPRTVSVFDHGTSQGLMYLVMEQIDGETLRRALERGAMSAQRSVRLAIQILESLEEAHHYGILHRDLKPSNVMIYRDFRDEEQIKVLDFGIAKLMEPEVSPGAELTQEEGFIGTPRYAAPEQLFAQELCEATDLYSVGALLWEMAVGAPMLPIKRWEECSRFHIIHRDEPMRVPREAGLPEGLTPIIERAVMRQARERWGSAAQMREALKRWLEGSHAGRPQRDKATQRDVFWEGQNAQVVDPNLRRAEDFFGEESSPAQTELLSQRSEESEEESSPRQRSPARRGEGSTLNQDDWGQSAAHIRSVQPGSAKKERLPPSRAQQEPAPQSALVSSSWSRRERIKRSAIAAGACLAVIGVVVVLAGRAWGVWERRDDEAERALVAPRQVAESRLEVPEGRFSSEGLWLAVRSLGWRRVSQVEQLKLDDLRQSVAFYELKGVTCEITLVEAGTELALHRALSTAREPTQVVRFDYRALKLHPVKGEGREQAISDLVARLKGYKRDVIRSEGR